MGAIAKEAVLKRNEKEKDFCIIVNFCIKMKMGGKRFCTIVVNFFKDENEMTNSSTGGTSKIYWEKLSGAFACKNL